MNNIIDYDRSILMIYRRRILTALLIMIGVSFLMAESDSLEEEREDTIALIKELFSNKNRSEEEDKKLSALIEKSNDTPIRESWEKYLVPIEYFLSPEMIQIYTDLANKGDGDAAYLLGKFYLFFGNDEIGLEWFEKGCELNNMDCLYWAGMLLINLNDEQQTRAVLYLKRLLQEAENGNEKAIDYADQIHDWVKREFLEENGE